jgi:phosphopentomutase
MRVILLVLDSLGVGATPDAGAYGDADANTLGHIADTVGGVHLPTLQSLGLGNVVAIKGMPPAKNPRGAFGKCAELSAGKDTATGHWEMAGLKIDKAFPVFENGFGDEILLPFKKRTGRGVIGNRPASGTQILDELGPAHQKTGDLIVYTSGDSVFQIAAHEDVVPIEELYRICRIAREILDPFRVARVIARPFVGDGPGKYQRTYNRKDFAMPPPGPTVLETLKEAGHTVVGVGKIEDIFSGRGLTEAIHSEGNHDGMRLTMEAMKRVKEGLIMVNLVDFDSLYGHRRDPKGYYRCLQEFDADLTELIPGLDPKQDLLMLSADHGNDPTAPGSDHTREFVPIVTLGGKSAGKDLGVRKSFADIGATIAEVFSVSRPPYGQTFLSRIA